MLIPIGKGIELDVDPARLNAEVTAHVMKIGLRNILMDSHANATQKADPEGYVKKSRELAEKKLTSLYEGIVRTQSAGGGIAKPTDPVAQVILRLARKAVQKDQAKELAALPKTVRLAALNKRAAEYATAHDAALRPRAVKIVKLESDEPTHDFPAKPVAKATTKKKAA
jgi:hypothetical protein